MFFFIPFSFMFLLFTKIIICFSRSITNIFQMSKKITSINININTTISFITDKIISYSIGIHVRIISFKSFSQISNNISKCSITSNLIFSRKFISSFSTFYSRTKYFNSIWVNIKCSMLYVILKTKYKRLSSIRFFIRKYSSNCTIRFSSSFSLRHNSLYKLTSKSNSKISISF